MAIKILFVDAEKCQKRVLNQVFKQIKSGKYDFYFSTSSEEVKDGIFNFLSKPHEIEDLEQAIDNLPSLGK